MWEQTVCVQPPSNGGHAVVLIHESLFRGTASTWCGWVQNSREVQDTRNG